MAAIPDPDPTASARPKSQRWLRRLALTSASLACGLLMLEVAHRTLLFSDWTRGWPLAGRLRHPELYAYPEGRDYWKLFTLFERPGHRRKGMPRDGRFGWLKKHVDPETFAHTQEPNLAGRTPLLLFGDSFGDCVDRAGVCWEQLLEDSELGQRYSLLNYAVGGYGLDQIYLLMRAVLPRFAAQDPLVVVGIFIDDDLDRSYLPIRIRPKPYFTLEEGALVPHFTSEDDPARFVAQNPVGFHSYLWRWCLFGSGLLARERAVSWTSERAHVAEKKAINGALLAAAQQELQALGLRYFFVLFHGEGAVQAEGPLHWPEPFLYEEFERLGIPFVSSKRYLRDHMRATGTPASAFYFHDDPGTGHLTGEGNQIVFQALRDGLEGRFESETYLGER